MKRVVWVLAVAACGGGEVDAVPRASSAIVPAPTATSTTPAATACELAHGTSQLTGAHCSLTACDEGFADCDGVIANGCEASLRADAATCGACGNACSTCDRGACGPLGDVAPDADARDLVARGSTLAWLSGGSLRVASDGVVSTWTTGLPRRVHDNQAGRIALGDGFAIVADETALRRVTKATSTVLAEGAYASVALLGDVAYALRIATDGAPGGIVRMSLATSKVTSVVEGVLTTHPCRIAVDGGYVWWTDPDKEIVWRVPLVGGEPEPWARRQRMACGVVVDDTWASWISVDPTLAVYLSRVEKAATPDPDWILTATKVGEYAPGKTGWDLAESKGTIWVANAHDGALWSVGAATGTASLAAGAQRIGAVAAGDVTAWATDSGVVRQQ
jgi:hypothetical protein